MLKKINSYLALTTTTLFVIHAGFMGLLLGGAIPYRPWYKVTGFLLIILFIGHAVLSLILLITNTKENNNGNRYWKYNKSTLAQRVLSIMLLFMAIVHVKNGIGLWGYQIVYIAIASGHMGISLPRALLTVGAVNSEKTYKRLQIYSVMLGIAITMWSAISYGIFGMRGH